MYGRFLDMVYVHSLYLLWFLLRVRTAWQYIYHTDVRLIKCTIVSSGSKRYIFLHRKNIYHYLYLVEICTVGVCLHNWSHCITVLNPSLVHLMSRTNDKCGCLKPFLYVTSVSVNFVLKMAEAGSSRVQALIQEFRRGAG